MIGKSTSAPDDMLRAATPGQAIRDILGVADRRAIRIGIRALIALICLSVLATILLMVLSSSRLDSYEVQKTQALAETAISQVVSRDAVLILDYAVWDEAVENLAVDYSADWADANVGANLNESFGTTVSLVLDADNVARYQYCAGETCLAADRAASTLPAVSDIARRARASAQSENGFAAIAGLVEIDRRAFVFSASAILPYVNSYADYESEVLRGRASTLLFFTEITPDWLAAISKQYLLPGAQIALISDDAAAASTPRGLAGIPLRDYNGGQIGRMSWRTAMPGSDFLTVVAPPVGLGLVGLVVLTLVLARYVTRSARAIARSNRQLSEAKNHAESMNRAKSDFLAHMSHEIRTPLNGVLGMLELLQLTLLNDVQQRYAEVMSRSGNALLALVNNVLDLSKIEAGKIVLDRVQFDPRELVDDVRSVFAEAAQQKSLELVGRVELGVPPAVLCDATRLRQVLLNLVGNAVKFTDKGSVGLTASVESADADGLVLRFDVSDSGIGISPEHQAQIFDAFRQEDGSTTRRFGGTGLGLTIAKQLVELMGGSLALESAPNLGTRVTLRVPAGFAQATPSIPAPLPAEIPALVARPRVLLVEDNPVNRDVAAGMLDALDYAVDVAEDGAVGVERYAKGGYPLVLMDCQLPRMDGYEATRRIRQLEDREKLPRAAIIAVTANALKDDIGKCLAAGMDDFVAKPVTLEALRAAIARHVPRNGEVEQARTSASAST